MTFQQGAQPPFQPQQQLPQHPQKKSGIKTWHLVVSIIVAFILGVVAMIGFAFVFDAIAGDSSSQDLGSPGSGSTSAVRYLDSKGIIVEPEVYDKVAQIICDSMANGSTGDTLTNDVASVIGTSKIDSSEVVAASAVYTCPEHIGKLAR